MKYTEKAVTLRKSILNNLLLRFQPDTQSYRIVQHIARNKFTQIHEIKTASGAENPNQVIRAAINPRLLSEGLRIGCERQPRGFVWSLYKMEGLQHAC
jgi:hypothetical protein